MGDGLILTFQTVTYANNYFNIGEYDKKLNYLNLGLKICEEQGYKRKIVDYLNQFGDAHLLKGEYDQALDYYTRSIDIIKELMRW